MQSSAGVSVPVTKGPAPKALSSLQLFHHFHCFMLNCFAVQKGRMNLFPKYQHIWLQFSGMQFPLSLTFTVFKKSPLNLQVLTLTVFVSLWTVLCNVLTSWKCRKI